MEILLITITFNLLIIFFIYLVIGWIWRRAEIAMYGKVTPRALDDIIAIALSISLFLNFK